MQVLGVHIMDDPGYSSLGELGLNTFWTTSSHEAAADRIAAVRAYRQLADVLKAGIAKATDAAAGETTDAFSTAQDLVERLDLRVGAAEDLVRAAQDAISGKNISSSAPPAAVTLQDWQLAYGVDVETLKTALKSIEEIRSQAEDDMNSSLRWAQGLKVARGEAAAASIPPASSATPPIDWHDPELAVKPEVAKAANAVGVGLKNAAGGIGIGLGVGVIALLGVGAWLFLGRHR